MAIKKGCQVGHKNCDCKLSCCAIPADRAEEIIASARSGKSC